MGHYYNIPGNCDLVLSAEEIDNGKLNFLCSDWNKTEHWYMKLPFAFDLAYSSERYWILQGTYWWIQGFVQW